MALLAALPVALLIGLSSAAGASLPAVHYWGHATDSFSVPDLTSYTAGGDIVQVATANSAWYALKTNGGVEAWGNNEYGELGDGTKTSTLTPVKVQFPLHVKIAFLANTGPQGSMLAVDKTGQAWGWGFNRFGELCTGPQAQKRITKPIPIQVPGKGKVTAIAGAGDHVLIVRDGTLYACGGNGDGDLGIGSETASTTPAVVPLSGVTAVYASWRNSGALVGGHLYSWGYGALGEVGDGSTSDAESPMAVSLPASVTSAAWGGGLKNDGQVLAVAGGITYAWGSDKDAQLGDGSQQLRVFSPEVIHPPKPYVLVETGGTTSFGLTAAGDLYGWGDDSQGQLGDGGGGNALVPVLTDTGIAQVSATANAVVDEGLAD
jgi:alpha-tubulin suppressor-like RCC1 family protein